MCETNNIKRTAGVTTNRGLTHKAKKRVKLIKKRILSIAYKQNFNKQPTFFVHTFIKKHKNT